ncbi:hypothetical protein BJ322DRAFT_1020455 [Thelephora terrestris]|uniref:Uncharacterized protein n=1 Tax=Thelephora terrestris TaxID=56493 RepID=A0A9P6HGT2_9AGAM|nr:hypothetical protein BJ322DRAFT_1020455 [Thelephora terrestris]
MNAAGSACANRNQIPTSDNRFQGTTLQVGFILENGARFVQNTLSPSQGSLPPSPRGVNTLLPLITKNTRIMAITRWCGEVVPVSFAMRVTDHDEIDSGEGCREGCQEGRGLTLSRKGRDSGRGVVGGHLREQSVETMGTTSYATPNRLRRLPTRLRRDPRRD